ncbi:putative stearoyl-CoA desaturase [Tilletiaria anomala UBC 951]|uniref:stearoyl-CoA 9-desaturase n=1 Tax=Tilletiaria anomala (strain ATCC 24038 / CBS 436.72 / UBC 951) TaxID=1037660 RepID=A0A066VJM4_TILAU|nr:putative stearoyl-CoA desaturase [Tilletiaria anomala UBC 951]KDN41691.1 putative stearoyl-CoA desaturase [Tilletiaria anomala UBC 951]
MSAITGDELRQRYAAQPAGLKTPPLYLQTPPTSDDESHAQFKDRTAGKGVSKNRSDVSAIPGSDVELPDDYVVRTLAREPALPPIQLENILNEIQWVSFIVLTTTPILAAYGMLTTQLQLKTFIWSVIYYFFSGLGITAGYHRLWAHRAYTASKPLQYILAFMGTSAVQGSIHWWARGHRAHHRYTDTDLDPYGAHNGLLWSHIGWMILKPRRKPGVADISDLRRNPVIKFQHKFYLPLILLGGLIVPTLVAGIGWNDWRGGFFYAAVCRLVFVHHSTFCVNSLAHWLGDATFDNKHTPRDHVVTALVTVGEGYHNFHHQFPMDYRNATKWYQYDPTKWFIVTMKYLGLASDLKQFPDNEVQKGIYTMKLQRLHEESQELKWPKKVQELPVISWDAFVEESKTRDLVVVQGIVHDVSSFVSEHPGGIALVKSKVGKDATTAFFGGVYDHSRAAQNLLATMRVGVIDGGYNVLAESKAYKRYQAEQAAVEVEEKAEAAVEAVPAVSAEKEAAARQPNERAKAYKTPGEAYEVTKHIELGVNETAKRYGGKVGKIL